MGQKLHDTSKAMTEWAKEHPTVLLGFSGGKDSLALLDLARRHFKKIVCFYMEFPVGALNQRKRLKDQTDAMGVDLIFCPHFDFINCLAEGQYCDQPTVWENTAPLTMRELFSWLKDDTGIDSIVFGRKKADSMWARRWFYLTRTWTDVLNPLSEWSKLDVLAYLKMRNIKAPWESYAFTRFNYCLIQESMELMREHYRDDYEVMLHWFPYAEAMHVRRMIYEADHLSDEDFNRLA